MAKRKRRLTKGRRVPREPAQLDIVIPVYGRADLLKKCLASVQRAKEDIKFRVFLVDDSGPDPEQVANVHNTSGVSDSVFLKNDRNMGFSWTVNRGVDAGNAPLVLILNSDIELKDGAIQAMVAEFDDLEVGVVGPKLLFPEDSLDHTRPAGKVQHAGLAVNLRGKIIHPNIGWAADHPKVNNRLEVQAVTGACIMTRRSVWYEVCKLYRDNGDPSSGAFNDVYGAGTYEDVEFCFAARTLGYKVIYTPEAEGFHHVGASVLQTQAGFPIERNEHIFYARCGSMMIWDEWTRT